MADSASDEDQQNGFEKIQFNIRNTLGNIGTYLKVTGAQKIIRRYFAMNAFDGAMTSLGVVIGAYLTNISNPKSIIGVILTSGVAMMVSGFSGTYMTESAERSHSLNELEDAMLVDLDDTIYGRASRFVSIYAALVDGSAPFLASIPTLIPFLLVPTLLDSVTAYFASMVASLLTLFTLGVYLGRISGENIMYSGLKMVVSGIAVAVIALLLNAH
ncbi:MAG: VIT1/CCC1 transporter family protein [Candidatus Bathyarchaeota archaeon]|nr:VIT1/CCC1 transporter family protein [Candidatus Bathyarchaeota archaeon]